MKVNFRFFEVRSGFFGLAALALWLVSCGSETDNISGPTGSCGDNYRPRIQRIEVLSPPIYFSRLLILKVTCRSFRPLEKYQLSVGGGAGNILELSKDSNCDKPLFFSAVLEKSVFRDGSIIPIALKIWDRRGESSNRYSLRIKISIK